MVVGQVLTISWFQNEVPQIRTDASYCELLTSLTGRMQMVFWFKHRVPVVFLDCRFHMSGSAEIGANARHITAINYLTSERGFEQMLRHGVDPDGTK